MNEPAKRITVGSPEASAAGSQSFRKPKHPVWLSLLVATAVSPCAFVLVVCIVFAVCLLYLVTFKPYGPESPFWDNILFGVIPLVISIYVGRRVYRRFRWGKVVAGLPPLHTAAAEGRKDGVELLLVNNADVNLRGGKWGWTPLHAAAWHGHKDVAELLLASRANVNAKDDGGHTPLHAAAITDHKDVVELLLNHQAEVNAKDNQGETPLKMAENRIHQAVAELLRQHGGQE